MREEHTTCGDTLVKFQPPNSLGSGTTSATEWAFVAELDHRPGGWPVEVVLPTTTDSSARGWTFKILHREQKPRKELERLRAEKQRELDHLQDPATLMIEEALAARLYTGPMYCK